MLLFRLSHVRCAILWAHFPAHFSFKAFSSSICLYARALAHTHIWQTLSFLANSPNSSLDQWAITLISMKNYLGFLFLPVLYFRSRHYMDMVDRNLTLGRGSVSHSPNRWMAALSSQIFWSLFSFVHDFVWFCFVLLCVFLALSLSLLLLDRTVLKCYK